MTEHFILKKNHNTKANDKNENFGIPWNFQNYITEDNILRDRDRIIEDHAFDIFTYNKAETLSSALIPFSRRS